MNICNVRKSSVGTSCLLSKESTTSNVDSTSVILMILLLKRLDVPMNDFYWRMTAILAGCPSCHQQTCMATSGRWPQVAGCKSVTLTTEPWLILNKQMSAMSENSLTDKYVLQLQLQLQHVEKQCWYLIDKLTRRSRLMTKYLIGPV